MPHSLVRSLIAVSAIFIASLSSASDKVARIGNWRYACIGAHKDAYGDVLQPPNCWAFIIAGTDIVHVFHFTKDRIGLSENPRAQACGYAPRKIAVDGRRIDTLSNEQQIAAVLKGKTITRQVWERRWPECTPKDISAPLDGAEFVHEKLLKMMPGTFR